MGLFGGSDSGIGLDFGYSKQKSSSNSTGSSKKVLSQEAFDKIVYDVLSSDQGLAALASGENASGGFGSATKSLMAQDLVTKLAGELANITAETVTTQNTSTKQSGSKLGGKVGTVICTELMEQGMLAKDLYYAGTNHFNSLSPTIVRGYQFWAISVVKLMRKSPSLCKFLLPIAEARYKQIVYGNISLLGSLTIYIGQPLCYLIGLFCTPKENATCQIQSL